MAADQEQFGHAHTSYFDWSPVWAGSAVAVAISLALTQFGAGVGLGLGETMVDETTPSWNVMVAGLWLVLTGIGAAAAGGYIAGRMRMPVLGADPGEREFRDGIHGLGVWAVGSILALLASTIITMASSIGAASASAGDVAETVARFAHNGSVILAFATAAAAAIGAGAAWFAAEAGGKHRDENTSVNVVVPGLFRKKTPHL